MQLAGGRWGALESEERATPGRQQKCWTGAGVRTLSGPVQPAASPQRAVTSADGARRESRGGDLWEQMGFMLDCKFSVLSAEAVVVLDGLVSKPAKTIQEEPDSRKMEPRTTNGRIDDVMLRLEQLEMWERLDKLSSTAPPTAWRHTLRENCEIEKCLACPGPLQHGRGDPVAETMTCTAPHVAP